MRVKRNNKNTKVFVAAQDYFALEIAREEIEEYKKAKLFLCDEESFLKHQKIIILNEKYFKVDEIFDVLTNLEKTVAVSARTIKVTT
jgi:hypothetical protein